MAKVQIVTMVDDLTGEPGEDVETVQFAVDGKRLREIDLSAANRQLFSELLAPYVANSRLVTGSGGPRTSARAGMTQTDREQNKAIRDWAAGRGYKINERGRIPQDILDEYHRSA